MNELIIMCLTSENCYKKNLPRRKHCGLHLFTAFVDDIDIATLSAKELFLKLEEGTKNILYVCEQTKQQAKTTPTKMYLWKIFTSKKLEQARIVASYKLMSEKTEICKSKPHVQKI